MLQTALTDIRQLSNDDYIRGFERMSKARQEKCRSYYHESDKKLCVAADMLVRSLIYKASGVPAEKIQILSTDKGKPYTDIEGLFISLSHSGDFAFAGISDAPIGVDIEKIRPVRVGTTRHFCTQKELLALHIDDNRRNSPAKIFTEEELKLYFEIWTFKEAYYKCHGFPEDFTKVDYFENKKHIERCNGYILCTVDTLDCP